MTATLPTTRTPDELHIDCRLLELLVTVDKTTGTTRIVHQAGGNKRADRAMSKLAAEIRDQHHDPDTVIIRPPGPGEAVMTCPLCRDVVDRGSLGWINRRALLVGCTSCAARAATWS